MKGDCPMLPESDPKIDRDFQVFALIAFVGWALFLFAFGFIVGRYT